MKLSLKSEPREFVVGKNSNIKILDYGAINLSANEQITFISDNNKKYDFTAKNWGYYVTGSLNYRLSGEGYKTALVGNKQNRIYVMVVDMGKMDDFIKYCEEEGQTILRWLDEQAKDV
jgi:hypothetical protein